MKGGCAGGGEGAGGAEFGIGFRARWLGERGDWTQGFSFLLGMGMGTRRNQDG